MNFQNLDYFVATATVRSFTNAADRLYITQQTLSGQIAALEKEIGHRLFIRSKPLQLTEAGKIVFNYATGLLRDYRKMQSSLALLNNEGESTITIGVSYPGAIQRLANVISSFRHSEEKPEVQLHFVEQPGDDLIDMLRMGHIDMAIASFPEHDPAFERFPLFEDEIVLLATDSLFRDTYGEAADAVIRELKTTGRFSLLKSCPYVRSARNNLVAHFADQFMEENISLAPIRAEAESFYSQIEICRSGTAFSFFPRMITANILHDETLSPFHVFHLGESARFTIHYGYLKNVTHSASFTGFLKIADEIHKERMREAVSGNPVQMSATEECS